MLRHGPSRLHPVIKLIAGADRGAHPGLIDAMFRGRIGAGAKARAAVDAYDDEALLYLVAVDPASEAVTGSLRLMPTTGRTLLKECFANRFDEPVDLASATIWEGTRLSVHAGDRCSDRTACELFIGTCEVGLLAGLTQIISLFDDSLDPLHRRIGWSPAIVGSSPRRGQPGCLHVGLWDVSPAALALMRARSGIHRTVLADPAPVREIAPVQ